VSRLRCPDCAIDHEGPMTLRRAVRESINDLDLRFRDAVPNVIAALCAAGAERNIHVGVAANDFTDEMKIEWFAGQILETLEAHPLGANYRPGAMFAVNALINIVDQYCPAEEATPVAKKWAAALRDTHAEITSGQRRPMTLDEINTEIGIAKEPGASDAAVIDLIETANRALASVDLALRSYPGDEAFHANGEPISLVDRIHALMGARGPRCPFCLREVPLARADLHADGCRFLQPTEKR
jgi:hypothetical protein